VITLNTEHGIDMFLNFVYYDLIPYLKDTYDNFFMQHLINVSKGKDGKSYYDLEYDPYSIKDNPIMATNFNLAREEFNRMANVKLGLKTTSGKEYTIGDILHLYSILTSSGLTTGLQTVTSEYKLSNIITKSLNDCYIDLDRLV